MFISTEVEIIKAKSGEFITVINGVRTVETDADRISEASLAYDMCRSYNEVSRASVLDELAQNGRLNHLFPNHPLNGLTDESVVMKGLSELIDFFKEFQFEPNFRFVNTLSYALANSVDNAKSYIMSYFELTDNPYHNEIRSKMESAEFSSILDHISKVKPNHTINNRFKLYYGSQGTGKTTIAQTETDKRCIVCNSSMLPADLMEDFMFTDGKATFKPSALWNCMEEGKAIVFDEINLLPFDSLRFLQGILDGKTEFSYKGNTVHINEGFKIIGTMNLTVNGMTYGLPEPLIDRCAEMRKFSLTPNVLLSAIISQSTASAETADEEK